MPDRIYLDNAATTRTDPDVVKAMLPYFTDNYAVASSQFSHTPGIQAKEALDHTRETTAQKLNCSPEEIVFTSGGTEANNLAIKGVIQSCPENQKIHLICSKIEHNSVLHTFQFLEKEGYSVTYLDVDEEGFIDLDQIRNSIRDHTVLVSVQHGNQEVGTVQPIQEIGRVCEEKGILFHTDASLSFTQLDLDMQKLPANLLTVSSHKIHGPKGVGALFVRKGTKLQKQLHGGYSEFDLRSGTENVAGVVGFGKAIAIAHSVHVDHLKRFQKNLIEKLEKEIEGVMINGPKDFKRRLPSNVNVSFNLIEGESVVLHLDMKGISVITGSACFSRSLEPSYVMMAMGYSHERAHGSIRFTFSRFNTMEEVDRVVDSCKEVVNQLRKISPLK